MTIIYFKDRFLPEKECFILPSDRAYRLGDGIFETMLVAGGKIYAFGEHMERLQKGANYLRIKYDITRLASVCEEAIKRNNFITGYMRITLSRGEDEPGTLGYRPNGAKPYCMVQVLPMEYPKFKSVSLYVSSHTAVNQAPCKTLSAVNYTLAQLEAAENGCDNALLLDVNGHLCETASANIFWIQNGTLYTPEAGLPLVPGIIRGKVFALWKGKKEQGCYGVQALQDAEEIFVTSAGAVLAPVTSIKPLGVSLGIGSHTQALRTQLDAQIQQTA